MANTTIYPFGTSGNLPSNIGVINDLTTGGADKALSAEMGKELKATIDNISISKGTYAQALGYALGKIGVFEWLLVDTVSNNSIVKPLWWYDGAGYVDAAGAVVSLATLDAPVFSVDSGDVFAGSTVTITCPSGKTLKYSVNGGTTQTTTSDATVTISTASVVKAYLEYNGEVSDIVAKTYGIAVDHKFQFKIKLTGNNSTEYVPVTGVNSPKYTMTVDWGDNSTPSKYTEQTFSAKGCNHTYSGSEGDEFTITLRGTAIPFLVFNNNNLFNMAALTAILDNSLECETKFSNRNDTEGGFNGCTNLAYLSANALQNSVDTQIVFKNTALTSFEDGFFSNIKNLTSCKNMFNGMGVTITASQMLEIKSIIKDCTDFYYMFYAFSGTAAIPDTFFDEVAAGSVTTVQNFTNAASTVTGDAKALYDVLVTKVTQSAETGSCFKGGGFTNKDQVPSGWK